MISPAMLGTADDGKRLVLYPLELSLRDLFAMAALQGLLANSDSTLGHDVILDGVEEAFMIADECLKERAK